MRRTIFTALALTLIASAATAQTATPTVPNRMKVCAEEWRAHKFETKNLKPGREAWNKFRTDCLERHPKPAKKRSAKATRSA